YAVQMTCRGQSTVARAVRRIYEKHPYPKPGASASANPKWMLAPLPWMETISGSQSPPQRILVAGCGTGNEAFALCQRLPEAEIVAVDFSPCSIRQANEVRRKSRRFRNI